MSKFIHNYVCPDKERYQFFLPLGSKRIRVEFKHHQWGTDDNNIANEIDRQLSEGLPIARHIRKLDKAAAEAALRKQLEAQRPAAIRGGTTSMNSTEAQLKTMAAKGSNEGSSPELLQEMADDVQGDMAVQVHTDVSTPAEPVEDAPANNVPVGSNPFAAVLKKD